MGDTHQFYDAPIEAYGEKVISRPACACAVRVRLLDGESQVRARGAQRSGLKGHVDDQVVVLRLREEYRVRRACYPARGRCALERDDDEVINFLALQPRGNTMPLALCHGIKD